MEALILVLLLVLPVAMVGALTDILRRPAAAFRAVGRSKAATLALVVLSGGVGGIYWFLVIRRSVARASTAHARRPSTMWDEDPWQDVGPRVG